MRSTRPSFTILPTTNSMYVSEMSGIRAHNSFLDIGTDTFHIMRSTLFSLLSLPMHAAIRLSISP